MKKHLKKVRSQADWQRECDDLIRGAAGGFLFGIPLLYTMEVWWIGSYSHPFRLLIALILTFIVVFLLNRTEGFRRTQNIQFIQSITDSVEALAIGIIGATFILILLREIDLSTPLLEGLGKVIFEGIPFAIGVALAKAFLSGDRNQSSDKNQNFQKKNESRMNATLSDIGATLIGAIIIAFNIAPTDEVPMLAAATSPPWEIAIMVASLLISYGIVFEAGFVNEKQRRTQQGVFQRPLSETIMAYLVSLLAAALMLWFFQKLSFSDPWENWLSFTIILGLPATIGGAAGRLAV